MAILISNKIDFKPNLTKRDKERHYILTTEKNQPDILIFNICTPNTRVPKFLKETWLQLKLHINPYTMIVGDFNSFLSMEGYLVKD